MADSPYTKALALLRRCLTERQRLRFDITRTIEVTGSCGGQYIINCNGVTANVTQVSGAIYKNPYEVGLIFRGKRKNSLPRRWCAYLPDCPDPDTWLAQKLLIETNEREFQRIAIT